MLLSTSFLYQGYGFELVSSILPIKKYSCCKTFGFDSLMGFTLKFGV